jgi:hypothetical protein
MALRAKCKRTFALVRLLSVRVRETLLTAASLTHLNLYIFLKIWQKKIVH